MSEIAKWVALAIYDANSENSDPDYLALARAAIEAMRTPTLAMVLAGMAVEADAQDIVLEQWQAMIDEALKP